MSVTCTHSDPPAIQGDTLTPLPVILTAIHNLTPIANPCYALWQHAQSIIPSASVALATSVILTLSGSNPSPLSAPYSLAATFAPSGDSGSSVLQFLLAKFKLRKSYHTHVSIWKRLRSPRSVLQLRHLTKYHALRKYWTKVSTTFIRQKGKKVYGAFSGPSPNPFP